jgi:hypothetical protein
VQQVVQVGHPDDRFVKIRSAADGSQPFDKFSLGRNDIVAQYIRPQGLPLAIFVQLLDEQAQSLMPLLVTHDYPFSLYSLRKLALVPDCQIRLTSSPALEANKDLPNAFSVAL